MSDSKPACFGKLPAPENRAIACGSCRHLDDCTLATMQKDFGKKGIVMEKLTL